MSRAAAPTWLRALPQEEEEALARALAEQRDDMEGETPRGEDDYGDEVDEEGDINGSQVPFLSPFLHSAPPDLQLDPGMHHVKRCALCCARHSSLAVRIPVSGADLVVRGAGIV